jgi:hypothetical protein
MYIITNNAPTTASITKIITDHTGSPGLSKGRNNKFMGSSDQFLNLLNILSTNLDLSHISNWGQVFLAPQHSIGGVNYL